MTSASRGFSARRMTALVLEVLLFAFVVLYCVQIVSPLRLNTDSYRFLSMALSASHGQGFLVDGRPDVFPEGYPALLRGMLRAGLGSTRWINALGIFSVLTGVLAFCAIIERPPAPPSEVRTLLVLLPLASWVWIKHSAIPLSEGPYCAVSYSALFALASAWQGRGWKAAGWLALGLLLSLAAWRVRSVGVSLLAAAAFTGGWHPQARRVWLGRLPRSAATRFLLALAVAALLVSGAAFVWRQKSAAPARNQPGYLSEQGNAAGAGGLPGLISASVNFHIQELGELFLNLPATRFARLRPVFLAAGLLGLAACLAGLPGLARRFPPLAVYTVAYGAIILVWPFYDPRFWMPLWPLLAFCLWFAVERWSGAPAVRALGAAYVAVFLFLGFAALGVSTRLSLSGQTFAFRYGDGSERDSYLLAFGLETRDMAPHADPRYVRMLEHFEPLARKQ